MANASPSAFPTFTALAQSSRALMRPSRRQEIVRLWILLIPLATAVCGSAAIQLMPTDRYGELMPPIFFVGALIVTAAMVHQRHLLHLNFSLTDELQTAHERVDILHQLSLELSTSLNVSQVAQAVLDHAMRYANAGGGALWLQTEIASSEISAQSETQKQWQMFAQSGLELKAGEAELLERQEVLENDVAPLPSNENVVGVPISWKGNVEGVLLLGFLQRAPSAEEKVLLKDISLVAGPALQNALLYQTTSERAEMDGLTRLMNHRAIQERLNQEVARVARARQSSPDIQFSIASMDITDFKLFNDTYGHAVGDGVLRRVSDCLKTSFRASDIVGRFGGDEFLVLLPDTPLNGAQILCERLAQTIAGQPFITGDDLPISIHLTCGVATFGKDGVSTLELLRAADERLYEAKRKGDTIVGPARAATSPEVVLLQPDWSAVGLLETLVATIDAKDHYTRGQCERAWRYALLIAQQMKFSRDDLEAVHVCSLIHDVGKIVIPDAILRKPGLLTEDEFAIMQKHTVFGALVVRDVPHLQSVLGGVRGHHEHWDGSGYPDKLAGEAIPLLGRVLAVADGYSAMTLQRPYRRAFSPTEALSEIDEQKGRRYDPAVVEAFAEAMRAPASNDDALQKILAAHDALHFARANSSSPN